MEYYSQDALLVVEERVVARTYEVVPSAQYGVGGIFSPGASSNVRGSGISHGIVLTAVVVARVCQEVPLAYLDYIGAFVDSSKLVLPVLRNGKALA